MYLNLPTPSMHSASSSPVRLNVYSKHLAEISTPRRLLIIWLFLSQHAFFLCLMIIPAGMCITHKSQRIISYFTSWTASTLDLK